VGRKLSLPLTNASATPAEVPSIDGMRARLGGRQTGNASGSISPGAIVRVPSAGDGERVGVLLVDDAGSLDVYLARGVVKRTVASAVHAFEGDPPSDLSRIAEQARVFASLAEGQPVHVDDPERGGIEARLREKCRFGALVETLEGKVLGVGFRRLWPRSRGGAAS
jgi:hypothetical protein